MGTQHHDGARMRPGSPGREDRAESGPAIQSTRRIHGVPTTVLQFSEENARVLMLLLKAQLAEFDSRKAKSRR